MSTSLALNDSLGLVFLLVITYLILIIPIILLIIENEHLVGPQRELGPPQQRCHRRYHPANRSQPSVTWHICSETQRPLSYYVTACVCVYVCVCARAYVCVCMCV
jgi:hypothetical protein